MRGDDDEGGLGVVAVLLVAGAVLSMFVINTFLDYLGWALSGYPAGYFGFLPKWLADGFWWTLKMCALCGIAAMFSLWLRAWVEDHAGDDD